MSAPGPAEGKPLAMPVFGVPTAKSLSPPPASSGTSIHAVAVRSPPAALTAAKTSGTNEKVNAASSNPFGGGGFGGGFAQIPMGKAAPPPAVAAKGAASSVSLLSSEMLLKMPALPAGVVLTTGNEVARAPPSKLTAPGAQDKIKSEDSGFRSRSGEGHHAALTSVPGVAASTRAMDTSDTETNHSSNAGGKGIKKTPPPTSNGVKSSAAAKGLPSYLAPTKGSAPLSSVPTDPSLPTRSPKPQSDDDLLPQAILNRNALRRMAEIQRLTTACGELLGWSARLKDESAAVSGLAAILDGVETRLASAENRLDTLASKEKNRFFRAMPAGRNERGAGGISSFAQHQFWEQHRDVFFKALSSHESELVRLNKRLQILEEADE